MSEVPKPAAGQTDSCRICGEQIEFEGRFWTHSGALQPRHLAQPMSGPGDEIRMFGGEKRDGG